MCLALEAKILILHFHFFILLQDCICDASYSRENEAKNLQNGGVHLTDIPDFGVGCLESHLAH